MTTTRLEYSRAGRIPALAWAALRGSNPACQIWNQASAPPLSKREGLQQQISLGPASTQDFVVRKRTVKRTDRYVPTGLRNREEARGRMADHWCGGTINLSQPIVQVSLGPRHGEADAQMKVGKAYARLDELPARMLQQLRPLGC